MKKAFLILSVLAIASVIAVGCGSSKGTQPLAQFEPEIVNDADAFQFQATGVSNVSTTVSYDWENSGSKSTVNHSSVLTAGTATVRIYDDEDNLVYTSGLVASLNEESSAGVIGVWRVEVELVGVSGTLNFSAEKLAFSKPNVDEPIVVDNLS